MSIATDSFLPQPSGGASGARGSGSPGHHLLGGGDPGAAEGTLPFADRFERALADRNVVASDTRTEVPPGDDVGEAAVASAGSAEDGSPGTTSAASSSGARDGGGNAGRRSGADDAGSGGAGADTANADDEPTGTSDGARSASVPSGNAAEPSTLAVEGRAAATSGGIDVDAAAVGGEPLSTEDGRDAMSAIDPNATAAGREADASEVVGTAVPAADASAVGAASAIDAMASGDAEGEGDADLAAVAADGKGAARAATGSARIAAGGVATVAGADGTSEADVMATSDARAGASVVDRTSTASANASPTDTAAPSGPPASKVTPSPSPARDATSVDGTAVATGAPDGGGALARVAAEPARPDVKLPSPDAAASLPAATRTPESPSPREARARAAAAAALDGARNTAAADTASGLAAFLARGRPDPIRVDATTSTVSGEHPGGASSGSWNMFHPGGGGIVAAAPLASGGAEGVAPVAPRSVPLTGTAADAALAANVRWMVDGGVRDARVNVSPAGLGPLSIRVSLEGEALSVAIVASQGAAREALEAMVPRLREQLAAHGHEGVQVDVSGGRGGEERAAADAERRDGATRGGDARSAVADDGAATGSAAAGDGRGAGRGVASGLIDAWV